ncbi:ComEC/Rec2 family competence protein [Alkaliphilus hydrothermalis]|uniref:Competence protein ComEC n=1 Tax=Alkaliphilus hydrothermalis TaxID=1482730 RepID=A0ABS2NS70_9FIRM|nr:ComEC/Rec2 family competence protein [Alkaliphilus hydrothermalis]MBM7615790.1 competence protein ComEC [Alkaliphilus hydrothermalis]
MNRPFTIILLFFGIGIILSHMGLMEIPVGAIFISFALLLLAMEVFRRVNMVWVGIALVLLGTLAHQSQFSEKSILGPYGENLPPLVVKILQQPTPRKNGVQVEVELMNMEGDFPRDVKEKAQLKIYGNGVNGLKPGEIVRIFEPKLVKEFNDRDLEGYEQYLRSRGVRYEISSQMEGIEAVSRENIVTLLGLSHGIKIYAESFLDKTLQAPQQEIMKSVLFGNQGYLSKDVKEAFSKSGTAHIVAVSGLHIGIIVMMLERILKLLGIGKNKRLLGISGCIFVYGYIIGFPVSIIRAGAMYLLYVLAYFLHRRYDPINCLMLIAFISLLYNPLYLFSVSFQLSFTATLSILVLYPILRKIPLKIPQGIVDLLAVTLAAQLGTAPIIAYHFKEISVISLLVNLLIVPTLGILLSMGMISVIISLISPVLGTLINYFTNGLLTYIYWMVVFSSDLPYSSISVKTISGLGMVFYYIILGALCYMAMKGKYLFHKESWRKDELSKDFK